MTLTEIIKKPQSPRGIPIKADWERLEHYAQCPIPSDYVDFLNNYGMGLIGDYPIRIFSPAAEFDSMNNWAEMELIKRFTRGNQYCSPSRAYWSRFVAFGNAGGGQNLGWIAGEKWRVIVFRNWRDVEEFQLSFSEFIVQLLTGKLANSHFPNDLSGDFTKDGVVKFGPAISWEEQLEKWKLEESEECE